MAVAEYPKQIPRKNTEDEDDADGDRGSDSSFFTSSPVLLDLDASEDEQA